MRGLPKKFVGRLVVGKAVVARARVFTQKPWFSTPVPCLGKSATLQG